jgi:hypothetical protein
MRIKTVRNFSEPQIKALRSKPKQLNRGIRVPFMVESMDSEQGEKEMKCEGNDKKLRAVFKLFCVKSARDSLKLGYNLIRPI